jgi:hypothetical protein
MRAVLGLSLIFGGSVLALYVLSGRLPFTGLTTAVGGASTARIVPALLVPSSPSTDTINQYNGGLP